MANSATNTILKAGFIAGLLDITAATITYIVQRDHEPAPMYRFIASGIFGKEALTGGWPMAIAGLLFHFMIAYIFTILFFIIYPKIRILSKNKVITGLVYGIIVWIIMNRVVVPLSNTPVKFPFRPVQAALHIAILMVCIGLPIALIVGRYYDRQPNKMVRD